jgi:hypothetical protein
MTTLVPTIPPRADARGRDEGRRGCRPVCGPCLHGPALGRTGVLRRIKLGRHVRFFRADIERLVREHDDNREVRIGLVFSNGGSIFLPHILGEARARELLLTAEPCDADWARATAFVNEVVAPSALDDAIERWVLRFEHSSRAAVAATKQILNLRFGSLLEESMQRETQSCVDLFDHPDCRAALQAFRARAQR